MGYFIEKKNSMTRGKYAHPEENAVHEEVPHVDGMKICKYSVNPV
jgi:hypothetical protein